MTNYALIDNGTVVNVIVWDGNTETWEPPAGMQAVAFPEDEPVMIGYTYSGTTFTAPAPMNMTLAMAQASALTSMAAAYANAIAAPVTYESKGGVTKAFQADSGSIANLQSMLLAFAASQEVPAGFYWVSEDNTQVPFTYSDLQGLGAAIGAQGFAAFAKLQSAKSAINAAATVAAVEAITWS